MGSIKTERTGLSPAEKGARLRRVGRALQSGAQLSDLQSSGYSWAEIQQARALWKLDPALRRNRAGRPQA